MPVVALEIGGNDKQEKREGYNKIEVNTNNYTVNGITVTNNGDGSLTLNGTNTNNVTYIQINATGSTIKNNYFNLVNGKKYYLYAGAVMNGNMGLYIRSDSNISYSLSVSGNEIGKVITWNIQTYENGFAFLRIGENVVLNNLTIRPMVAESDVELEYEAYGAMPSPSYPSEVETVNTQVNIVVENEDGTEQQTKVVDIQQEMLEGDYFVKEEDGWKEVQTWGKYTFTGNESFSFGNTYQDKYRRFSMAYDESLNVKKASWDEIGAKSNNFIGIANKYYSTAQNNVWINEQSRFNISIDIAYLTEDSANGLKAWLAQKHTEGNPVYLWYKLATPTKLTCTEKQIEQLDDLLNTSTYKNVTHIYSTDKVSPIIKIKYRKDIETMLNSQKNDYDTRLSNIEKLLSTTTTSALLLDNLQSDLEKEVL